MGDAVCSGQGTHASAPVTPGGTAWAVAASRAGVREKVRSAAALSHAIACGAHVGTRPISSVVQERRAPCAVAGGPLT